MDILLPTLIFQYSFQTITSKEFFCILQSCLLQLNSSHTLIDSQYSTSNYYGSGGQKSKEGERGEDRGRMTDWKRERDRDIERTKICTIYFLIGNKGVSILSRIAPPYRDLGFILHRVRTWKEARKALLVWHPSFTFSVQSCTIVCHMQLWEILYQADSFSVFPKCLIWFCQQCFLYCLETWLKALRM